MKHKHLESLLILIGCALVAFGSTHYAHWTGWHTARLADRAASSNSSHRSFTLRMDLGFAASTPEIKALTAALDKEARMMGQIGSYHDYNRCLAPRFIGLCVAAFGVFILLGVAMSPLVPESRGRICVALLFLGVVASAVAYHLYDSPSRREHSTITPAGNVNLLWRHLQAIQKDAPGYTPTFLLGDMRSQLIRYHQGKNGGKAPADAVCETATDWFSAKGVVIPTVHDDPSVKGGKMMSFTLIPDDLLSEDPDKKESNQTNGH